MQYSGRESIREKQTAEIRQWCRAWDLLREIEAVEERKSGRRTRLILACRHYMEGSGNPRLEKLAKILQEEISDRELLAVMVPVERVVSRTRISDAEMGLTGQDRPERQPFPLYVVTDNIRSALNMGGIFRTADAMGAEEVWICGYSATPEHPALQRSALGAERKVPWKQWQRLPEALAALRGRGVSLCALETTLDSESVQEHDFSFPCALIVGNERFGLDPEQVAAADHRLYVPMFGYKNSLNVVSALAVAGYAARRCWSGKECVS